MNTTNLKVALVPLQIEWGDKIKNLAEVKRFMNLIHRDADIVIFPETFSTGFPSMEDKEFVRVMAERNTGETMQMIHQLANHYNIAIAGSFIADTGGLLFNRGFIVEPSGDEYFYDKRHLFTMANEHVVFNPGDSHTCIRYRGWNISIVICYDIRFPVWCRNQDNKYDLLICVANWPKVRVDAWNKLLFARAIENQSYVCGVNCKGVDKNGYEYDGSSMIIDYKGNDISIRIDETGIVYATLCRSRLDSFRKKFPVWDDSDEFFIKNMSNKK